MISGHITVCKIFKDGTKEVVLDRENLITAGLGSSLADLLEGKGSDVIKDYAPRYFQVGTSTVDYDITDSASAVFFKLSSAFDWEEYGEDTEIPVVERYRCFVASTADYGRNYSELFLTSATFSSTIYSGTDDYFGRLQATRVTKWYMDSFESEIVLDEKSGNGKDITEVGLYIKNPRGLSEDSPLLIAYKKFNAISKEEEFSIIIHWSIGFLGVSNYPDRVYTGGGNPALDPRGSR